MRYPLPPQFFVTGTDTMVGKTVVSAILTVGLDAFYWKPIQSGLDGQSDSEFVKRACEMQEWRVLPESYRLQRPLSPHLSARLEGRRIELDDIHLPIGTDRLIVEGAGGLMVPLNEKSLVVDMVAKLGLPVLLVSRSTLGTINHTMLSVEALRSRSVHVLGVVMNGLPNPENKFAIEHYAKVPVLAELPPLPNFDRETLKHAFAEYFGGIYLDENWRTSSSMAPVYPDGNRAAAPQSAFW